MGRLPTAASVAVRSATQCGAPLTAAGLRVTAENSPSAVANVRVQIVERGLDLHLGDVRGRQRDLPVAMIRPNGPAT